MMRIASTVAALALLGACNLVITRTPLFAKADARRGPKLRPGVWEEAPSADCKPDDSLPLSDWPTCADGFVVVGDGTIGGYERKDGKPVWATTDAVVAAGDPLIVQIHLAGTKSPGGYLYAGLAPTKLDEKGRAVATASWPVLCGPPPPDEPGGARHMAGTRKPFPGLIMDAQGDDCTTDSRDVIRGAAKASRGFAAGASLSTLHWVRDGDR